MIARAEIVSEEDSDLDDYEREMVEKCAHQGLVTYMIDHQLVYVDPNKILDVKRV